MSEVETQNSKLQATNSLKLKGNEPQLLDDQQSAAGLVGNAEVAEALISESGQMQVIAQLKLDPSTFSGYAWSSSKRSPQQKMSPGITTSVRVILEEKAPITFVFPIL